MILVRLAIGTAASGPDWTVTPSWGPPPPPPRPPATGAPVSPRPRARSGERPLHATAGTGRPSCTSCRPRWHRRRPPAPPRANAVGADAGSTIRICARCVARTSACRRQRRPRRAPDRGGERTIGDQARHRRRAGSEGGVVSASGVGFEDGGEGSPAIDPVIPRRLGVAVGDDRPGSDRGTVRTGSGSMGICVSSDRSRSSAPALAPRLCRPRCRATRATGRRAARAPRAP